ncbi:MAG: hypothetical protein OJF52_002238 [Nitrospira sp.]|nr:MAG: hypothetical protein OJF52_002238 [Nitrospira sp.]
MSGKVKQGRSSYRVTDGCFTAGFQAPSGAVARLLHSIEPTLFMPGRQQP